jgi:predicted molibdopterin-dependent oxidoreductase YjgC
LKTHQNKITSLNKDSTVCVFCSCGCRIYVRRDIDDSIIGLLPSQKHPITKGTICIRGWHSHEFTIHPDRLRKPLIKVNGKQIESSWKDAVTKASSGLASICKKWGPSSIAFIGSPKCANEDNYLLMKLARDVIKSSNIDTSNRVDYFPIFEALEESLGSKDFGASFDSIEKADLIITIGADLQGCCPQGTTRVYSALEHGSKLVVVDPRITNIAKIAKLHLRLNPGSDIFWINGIISLLLADDKFSANSPYIKIKEFGDLKNLFSEFSFEDIEKSSKIIKSQLKILTDMLLESKSVVFIVGDGITNTFDIKGTIYSLTNLLKLTGHIKNENSGILVVGAENNTRGALDMGISPFYSPKRTKKSTTSNTGRNYLEILDGIVKNEIKALYVMGDDILAFNEYKDDLTNFLSNLELFVVQDIFPTKMNQMADVVLPASTCFEKPGTFTNLEGRVQYFEKILDPLPDTKPDWEILYDICCALGSDFGYKTSLDVMDDIALNIPYYQLMNSRNLKKELEGIKTGKGESFHQIQQDAPGDSKGRGNLFIPKLEDINVTDPSEEFPFILLPGRFTSFWNKGTRSSRIDFLYREENRASLQLNPDDAKKIGVKNGWRVKIVHSKGEMKTSVIIDADLPGGIVYLPLHNIDGHLLPGNRKSIPVRIEPC